MTRIQPSMSFGCGFTWRYSLPTSSDALLSLLSKQMTKRGQRALRLFDLELFLADSMSFIPVQLHVSNFSAEGLNCRLPLHFPPAPRAIHASQPGQFANRSADGNDFHLADRAEDFEIHFRSVGRRSDQMFRGAEPTYYVLLAVIILPKL